jgi:hypothetical protein
MVDTKSRPKPPNAGKGRPPGSRNKRLVEVEQLATRIFDPDYMRLLKIRIREGKAPHMETFLASHKWGLPKKTVVMEGDIPPFVLLVDDDEPRD